MNKILMISDFKDMLAAIPKKATDEECFERITTYWLSVVDRIAEEARKETREVDVAAVGIARFKSDHHTFGDICYAEDVIDAMGSLQGRTPSEAKDL